MPGPGAPGAEGRPAAGFARVDEACDRFEAAWRAGQRPRIEDHLAGADESDRPLLLRELLGLELELRQGRGERPEPGEYLGRFPEHAGAVRAALGVAPAGAEADTARNLLFGMLALQNNFVKRDDLLAAFNSWVADRSRPMSQVLRDRQALDDGRQAILDALVGEHLRLYGGDPQRSLAALAAMGPARLDLGAIADPDVQASLTGFASPTTQVDDPAATQVHQPTPAPGSRFLVLRPHARGGLGEVFVARDKELNREVALKQIRPEYAHDPDSRTRFLLEAEVTGGLEHPGIVPVYGLGAYADGRPYYAMRFIKGDSLKDAIQAYHDAEPASGRDPGERAPALRRLLRRFLDVCDAVGYAHSRGILHRDLKPANVMLGRHGETLVVDWGLAKSLGHREGAPAAAELTLRPSSGTDSTPTQHGSAVGTPAYMSPEQAAGRLDDLGPASDVYSLGATLYCLLTGRAPFEGPDVGEVLRRVQAGDFPPPRGVKAGVSPALEAVCLKAMAPGPGDRYASAKGLADDVERWLADDPVSAYREGLSARLGRWARRHRAGVQAAGAALVVVAVLATASALVVERARRGEKTARGRVTTALEAERAAKADAEANLTLARTAVEDYFTKVSENDLLKRQDAADARDLRPLRKELLEVALDYYKRLIARRSSSPTLRSDQASAYARVGRITEEIGAKGAALEAHRQALAIRKALADAHPDNAPLRRELAASHISVGSLLGELGREAEAMEELEHARATLQPLADANPDDAETLFELARVDNNRGLALRESGRNSEALEAFEHARATLQRLADADPGDTGTLTNLATSNSNIGLLHHGAGRTDEALAALVRAREIFQRLADAEPAVTRFQNDLAASDNNIGFVLRDAGRTDEALAALGRGRTTLRRLADAHPSVTVYRNDLATNHINLGTALAAAGRPAEALAEFESARAILRRLTDAEPSVLEYRRSLNVTLVDVGDTLRALGRTAEAREPAEHACAALDAMDDRAPFDEFITAIAHDLCADLLDKAPSPSAGDRARREVHATRALAALRRAVAGGYRAVDPSNFVALRSRPEFQDLMRDLAFPDQPFVGEPDR